MASKIQIAGVTKSFMGSRNSTTVKALDEVSFMVEEGELVCILGPSGCGKTTLLNIIAGFIAPDTGYVSLDGKKITRPGPDRAVVFQDAALFPWLTVGGNIEFGLKEAGMAKADRQVVVRDYARLVGLQGFENSYPFQLSGGMKQRVALARSLAIKPAVLLLDEPFGALDAQTRRIMQEELSRIINQTKETSVLITHAIDEALFLADTLIVMSAAPGRILLKTKVELPRPRKRTDLGFMEFFEKVEEIVKVEVNKTMVRSALGSGAPDAP